MDPSEDYTPAVAPRTGNVLRLSPLWWRVLRTTSITLLVIAAVGFVLFGYLRIAADSRDGSRCANNLRQIGIACLLYAKDNGGQFPDSLVELFKTGELKADSFVCPLTTDTPASGPTTQAAAANLAKLGHLSYDYAGKGLTDSAPRTAVVAYEPLTNHGGQGTNVVFADAHVEFVKAAEAAKMVAELEAGHNPPRSEKLYDDFPQTSPVTLPGVR